MVDADKLAEWLAANVCEAERRYEQVSEELLARCRAERIEPPAVGRVDRIVRSALAQAEKALTARIAGRLPAEVVVRLRALVDPDVDEADAVGEDVLSLVKSVPGNMSLETMLTEIRKLRAVRAVGLPVGLFADVAPKVLGGWGARAAVEAPSHLHTHPEPLMLTLLAALLPTREREITDTLVELLIATVHRIGARADRKVTEELVNAFKKVTGKENILFAIAEASLARPDEAVRQVVYPAVSGGEQTLRELVHEYKTKGPVYRRTVQTTLKASYTTTTGRGLIELLDVLEFRSNNATTGLRWIPWVWSSDTPTAATPTTRPAGTCPPTRVLGDWSTLAFTEVGGRRLRRAAQALRSDRTVRAVPACPPVRPGLRQHADVPRRARRRRVGRRAHRGGPARADSAVLDPRRSVRQGRAGHEQLAASRRPGHCPRQIGKILQAVRWTSPASVGWNPQESR